MKTMRLKISVIAKSSSISSRHNCTWVQNRRGNNSVRPNRLWFEQDVGPDPDQLLHPRSLGHMMIDWSQEFRFDLIKIWMTMNCPCPTTQRVWFWSEGFICWIVKQKDVQARYKTSKEKNCGWTIQIPLIVVVAMATMMRSYISWREGGDGEKEIWL